MRRWFWAGLLVVGVAGSTMVAQAPPAGWVQWESSRLNLRYNYPADLVKHDPAEAFPGGHLQLFGITGDSDPELAQASHCLKPQLLLETPAGQAKVTTQAMGNDATKVTVKPGVSGEILLAELDIECLPMAVQMKAQDLLAHMAEVVNRVQGARPTMQPTWYTIGYQKVHVAGAQGQLPVPGGPPQPLYTMAISTNWNSRLLVWYFSANDVATLDRLTKTTVRFGRAEAAPLYPLAMGNASQ